MILAWTSPFEIGHMKMYMINHDVQQCGTALEVHANTVSTNAATFFVVLFWWISFSCICEHPQQDKT